MQMDIIVVSPTIVDHDLGCEVIAERFNGQTFVADPAVDVFGGAVLPDLPVGAGDTPLGDKQA